MSERSLDLEDPARNGSLICILPFDGGAVGNDLMSGITFLTAYPITIPTIVLATCQDLDHAMKANYYSLAVRYGAETDSLRVARK